MLLPGHPNREARESLNFSLLRHLVQNRSPITVQASRMRRLLEVADFARLKALLQALYAGIPIGWHRRNEIARFEGYYASMSNSYLHGAEAGRDRGGQQ